PLLQKTVCGVEEQQRPATCQLRDELGSVRRARAIQTARLAHHWRDRRRILQSVTWDEPDLTAKLRQQILDDLAREATFPDTAETDDGDQPRSQQEAREGGPFALAPDKLSPRERQLALDHCNSPLAPSKSSA